MSSKVVNFEIEKETKNSVRYKEVPEEDKPLSLVACTCKSGLPEPVKIFK
jgi:hypothetical protein